MESHRLTLKTHHTLKNKRKFHQTCLSFPVSHLSIWPYTSHSEHTLNSHVNHTSHTNHTGLVGTFSRVSQSLQSVPASSNLHFLNWNSHNKQRCLQLSGLIFLRRQWGRGGLNNIFFSCHACVCIFREKNLKKTIEHIVLPKRWDHGVLSLSHCVLYCLNILWRVYFTIFPFQGF